MRLLDTGLVGKHDWDRRWHRPLPKYARASPSHLVEKFIGEFGRGDLGCVVGGPRHPCADVSHGGPELVAVLVALCFDAG